MGSTVLSAVTAATQMAATPPRAIAAASLDGQVSTVTACVLKAAGAPIVRCPVTVKMGHPALLTKASVSVLRDSGAPLARESVPLVSMGTAAARHARSVSIAAAPATTSQAYVIACLASLAHSVMKCVPVADLEKTVPEFVHAPTTEPVIPLTDRASVTRVGLAVTAPSHVHLPTGAQTVSTRATATMEPSAVPTTGNANVLLAGLGSTAPRDVLWGFMARIVP